MTLLQPLALFFLAVLPLIALLYMLRIRRQDVTVSSLMLWRELKSEATERLAWRPPIWSTLLLLQLLIALALALALARPSVLGVARPQKHAMVLIDASGSMQASDIRPTRFAEAKRQARQLIDGLNSDDTMTVIRAGERATIVGTGNDRALILKAIDELTPGAGAADMKTALTLAKSLGRPDTLNEIDILSDGGFTGAESVPDIPATVRLHTIGRAGRNVGLASVSARQLIGSNRCEGFARLVNYGDGEAAVPLVALVDGSRIEQRTVQLGVRGQSDLWFDLPAGARTLEVRITPNDVLPLDDAGVALCPRPRTVDALLVSDTPGVLQTALGALPNLKLTVVPPGQYTPGRQADLYIFESTVPDKLPANNAGLLIVGPRAGGQLLNVQGASTGVTVVRSDPTSPLLATVDLGAIQFPKTSRFELPEWGRAVADMEEGPLIVSGEREGRRIAVLGFDLEGQVVPSRLPFPLLIANSVAWLSPEPVPDQVAPGQALTIQPATAINEIVVDRPNGESESLRTRGEPVTYTRTDLLGRYRVVQRNGTYIAGEEMFVVGPMPESESRIRPITEIAFSTALPSPEGLRASLGQEIWPLLATLGLALLGVEWWWFHFRR